MSDKEVIIKSLKKVERRLRSNRLLTDLTFSLSLFLLFILGFKVLDLISPFRGRTVVTVLSVWILCVAGYFIWRSRHKGSLAQAAADVDVKAALSDELKSAYWFINNPRASAWVDAQIRRAAGKAGQLNIDRLYPRSVPKTSWLVIGLFALVIALNFAPLPWNNNWLLLQAAPAFSLTDSEQALLREAEEALANTELAERVREIMQQLRDGTITADEALQQLEELQKELGQGDLDMAAIDAALDEVAEALAASPELAEIAQALRDMDVADAADLLKELAEEATAEEMTDMQSSLEQASENAKKSLDDLAADLKDAADSIAVENQDAARKALTEAAGALEELAEQIQNQEKGQQASQQLQQFQQSLEERLQAEQQQAEQAPPQPGESPEAGEPQPGGGMPSAAAGPASEQQGDPQQASDGGNQDTGQNPSGLPGETKNQPAVKLELEIQLEQAGLTGLYDEAPEPEKIEETSKQERSKLDYRNVESELTPAQKDLLNQEQIPWEYRNLIKNYFEAIKPPQEKQ